MRTLSIHVFTNAHGQPALREAQVSLACTDHRQLIAKLQFLDSYPNDALVTQLQSRTLAPALLAKLAATCDDIAAQRRGTAHAQVVVQLLQKFVLTNRLATAFDELQRLREMFTGTACRVVSAKQNCGSVNVELREGTYSMTLALQVPPQYPAEALRFEVVSHSLPDAIVRRLTVSCTDTAARRAAYQAAATDVLGAQARAGSGSAAQSKTDRLARSGMQTLTSYNRGQVRGHMAEARRTFFERLCSLSHTCKQEFDSLPVRSIWRALRASTRRRRSDGARVRQRSL